jgi:hypothetical protein
MTHLPLAGKVHWKLSMRKLPPPSKPLIQFAFRLHFLNRGLARAADVLPSEELPHFQSVRKEVGQAYDDFVRLTDPGLAPRLSTIYGKSARNWERLLSEKVACEILRNLQTAESLNSETLTLELKGICQSGDRLMRIVNPKMAERLLPIVDRLKSLLRPLGSLEKEIGNGHLTAWREAFASIRKDNFAPTSPIPPFSRRSLAIPLAMTTAAFKHTESRPPAEF